MSIRNNIHKISFNVTSLAGCTSEKFGIMKIAPDDDFTPKIISPATDKACLARLELQKGSQLRSSVQFY